MGTRPGGLRKEGSRRLGLPWTVEGCPTTMGEVAGGWGVIAPATFAERDWLRTFL